MKYPFRNWCQFSSGGMGLALVVSFSLRLAAEPVTVSVNTQQPGVEISEAALGVSYETSRMLPDAQGVHYFRADNQALVTTFRTLGIKSLRIGGNSVDAENIPIPSAADVSAFFEFAKAAGVKVIYSVRLKDGEPQSAAKIAKLIHDRYAAALDCLAIGNEPYYYKDYAVYTNKWTAIRDAILAVYPEAKFCGPDQNPNPELMKNLALDFGNPSGRLVELTQHNYPFGCAYKNYKQVDITKLDSVDATTNANGGPVLVPFDPAASREKMLSAKAYAGYESLRKGLADAVAGTSVSFRLTEANSFWFSGLKGASDSYAAALWGLDYLHWWVEHGAAGVNFHTGDRTGGTVTMPCRYAVFVSSTQGYKVRPLGYGMKLFELGGHGKSLPVNVSSASDQELVAYAVLADDKTVFVTLINKAHGIGATNTEVQLGLDAPVVAGSKAEAIFLTAKNGDLAGGSADVTLGGAPIKDDGIWQGQWTTLPVATVSNNVIVVTLPPASAAVVKVTIQ